MQVSANRCKTLQNFKFKLKFKDRFKFNFKFKISSRRGLFLAQHDAGIVHFELGFGLLTFGQKHRIIIIDSDL